VANGAIVRDVTINLAALRRLRGSNSVALRRYVLGLALVAGTHDIDLDLRSGCLLCLDPDHEPVWHVVTRLGEREAVQLDRDVALAYAMERAKAFGVGPSHRVTFDPALVSADLTEEANGKPAKQKKGKAA
jgi:CRISPR-associated protein Csb1